MALVSQVLNVGLNSAFGIMDYKNAREEGNGKAMSVAKAVGSFAAGEMLGMWMLPIALIPAAGQITSAMAQQTGKQLGEAYAQAGKLGSGYFNMSQTGYTMRQRSLNAIRSNGLNTRSVLGNEARTYFRSTDN